MSLKFNVKRAETSAATFFSTSARVAAGSVKEVNKDYRLEVAQRCDASKIACFLMKNFVKEEPMSRALLTSRKPSYDLEKLFADSASQELSVIARSGCGSIVGVSVNDVDYKLKADQLNKLAKATTDCNLKKFLEVHAIILREAKLHEKLCIDNIFNIGSVCVAESHYGQGIGLETIKKSLQVARDRKFLFAKMACTCENRRKIAETLNMKKVWSASYADIMCRGDFKPQSLPDPPHTEVNVFYLDSKTLQKC